MALDNSPPVRPNTRGFWHGGDYNPEQWDRDIWDKDAVLMDKAHWNVATVGVFSWVSMEPEEGRYTFDWMEEILDRLHRCGRAAILATPSAAAPAWLSQRYPETLRAAPGGQRNRHGNRVNYCLTSPVYRRKAQEIAAALADRFGDHPALALWHVSNEFGGPCYCDVCQDAFRESLRRKFGGDLERLNAAYWTKFWSHTYTDWSQIEIPGPPHGETAVHGLSIDWRRFVSDQTIDFYIQEAAPLRERTPHIPVTTNLMGFYPWIDYWKLAPHMDVVAWDSYPAFAGPLDQPATWMSCAFSHDLNRSLRQGQPYLLMECTPSASNWYSEMELKRPGMNVLEGIQAVAHGADSVQYFQWRQSRGGQEKFHGGVVGHDGTEHSRVFQEVASLGKLLGEIGEVAGSRTKSEVALVYDWENAWLIEAACAPRQGPRGYWETCRQHHTALLKQSIPVDLIPSDGDLSSYKLVIAPMLTMVRPGVGEAIERFVQEGGTFVTTYWSGISDENDLCFLGGFPGGANSALRRTLGIWSEELDVIYPGEKRSIKVDAAPLLDLQGSFTAATFCDLIHAESATVLGTYEDGFYAGRPCFTVNQHGSGHAYFVASRNDDDFVKELVSALAQKLDLEKSVTTELPDGVVARHRVGDREYLFLLNLTNYHQTVSIEPGYESLTGAGCSCSDIALAPYGVGIFARPKV
jgi:beta-galactosidase